MPAPEYQNAEIATQNLCVSRGGRVLFSALTLNVASGQAVLLHGANGSGKTSLMRALAGFIEPHSGQITLTPGPGAVGFMGHQLGLKANETVLDALNFFDAFGGQTGSDLSQVLKDLALSHLTRRMCGSLSAGQKQRVGLARLVLSNRAIWLMDEPAAPLDLKNRARLKRIVEAHRAQGGLVVAATHIGLDWDDAERVELRP